MVRRADAVFEGGGVKGIGLAGALAVAEARGYRWVNVAGTSAGAIVAALVAAGYRAGELQSLVMGTDYRQFGDPGRLGRVPLAGPALNLVFRNGLYEGRAFEAWMRERLAAKGVRTFGDLVLPGETEDRYRFKLRVIATDITRGRLLVLPQDIAAYGARPEDLDVARAVRMSMSIPFFYRPVRAAYPAPGGGDPSYVVDGGVLSNFPVWLFDVDGVPPWPTFGFRLVEPEAGRPHRVRGPISLAMALLLTMLEAHDARHLAERDWVRTIGIPTLGVRTTDFDISRERAAALYAAGVAAAERFFATWDFAAYVERYRRPEPPNDLPGGRAGHAHSLR